MKYLAALLTLFWVCPDAQADDRDKPVEKPAALTVTTLGSPTISFVTVNDYKNGVTINHNTFKVTGTLGLAWAIQVRASGNLTNGSYTIPISQVAMYASSFSGTGVSLLTSSSEFFLSTVNQNLATGLLTLLAIDITVNVRYRALGGPDFYKPGGNYTTTLTVTTTGL